MPWYEATLDWLTKHVPWQIIFGIFVASGVLLFFAVPLGIDGWVRPYRGLEITFCVFSAAVLLANVITLVSRPIAAGVRNVITRRGSKKHLHQLNPLEKKHCKYFVDNDGMPLADNPANGGLASLVANGIIWQTEKGWDWMFHFNIYPWALKYLKEHPELLDGAKDF